MRLCLLLAFVVACGSKSAPQSKGPLENTSPGSDCIKSGCSGTQCVEPGKEVMTTCEYKPEYGCYREGTCERQGDGKCGWTQSPELQGCLANPPAMDSGGDVPR